MDLERRRAREPERGERGERERERGRERGGNNNKAIKKTFTF